MNKDKKEYFTLLAVFILILILVFTIVVFIKNINLIKNDALLYGMEKHDFYQCSCLKNSGGMITVNNGIPNGFDFGGGY